LRKEEGAKEDKVVYIQAFLKKSEDEEKKGMTNLRPLLPLCPCCWSVETVSVIPLFVMASGLP